MANVTLSQRHPAAPELFADGPHAATLQFVIGDAALALEKGRTLDMGLRYRGGPLRWQLDAFVNDFGDYIYLAPTPLTEDGLPVFEYRQADARFTGLEGVLEAPLWTQASRELTLDLSADVVRARLRDGGGNLPQLPPWRVGAGLRFESSDWKAGVALWHYGRQGRVAAYETATDGYTLVEARVERQWLLRSGPRLTASLRGSNLTDQLARRHSSPLKDVVPLPGRGVTLSLRLAL